MTLDLRPATAFFTIVCSAAAWTTPLWAEEAPPQPKPPAAAPSREDPAVAGILATRPATPKQQVRAAKLLADLGRPDLARPLLKQALDAKLDAAQLADLGAEFGSPMFAEMAMRADLAPEGRQLADAVLQAVKQRIEDPQRLAALVKQLQDPLEEQRYRALAGLVEARGASVNPLVAALADPARAAEHHNVRAALARLQSDAVGPLRGILESGDPLLAAQAADILGAMGARDAVLDLLLPFASEKSDPRVRAAAGTALMRLVGKLPEGAEAAGLLARMAREYFDGRRSAKADVEGRAQVWEWDAAKKQVVGRELPVAEVNRKLGARLAREAFALAPDDGQVRLLYLATMLEEAKHQNGLDKPLPSGEGTPAAKAAAFGVDTIDAVLKLAMETDHPAAAAAAAEILGRSGKADEVLRRGSGPAPLALALRSGDRRLRMAALAAILQLKPGGPFPGSSYVPEALAFFVSTSGSRRVMVAAPSTQAATSLTAYLVPLGYEVHPATNGREAIRKLIASADYEMVFLDASLSTPPPDLLIQELRRDGRTARLPVGVFAAEGMLEKAQRMVRGDRLAVAFPRPYSAETAKWEIGDVVKLAGPDEVPFAERQRQAAQAIAWLAELSAHTPCPYNLQTVEDAARAALYVPHLGAQAAAMLANLGTPASQAALVDLASRPTQPLSVRKAAAVGFGQSVRRFGILLTTAEIRRQYDRYNASANEDPETQKVLGLLLDQIEAPTKGVAQAKPEEPEKPEKPKPKE